jgi:hypothetical protein
MGSPAAGIARLEINNSTKLCKLRKRTHAGGGQVEPVFGGSFKSFYKGTLYSGRFLMRKLVVLDVRYLHIEYGKYV